MQQQNQSDEDFKTELQLIEKSYGYNETVIADFYQLGMFNGKSFSRNQKQLIRENFPIELNHFLATNENWKSCGKLYVLKEKETEQWKAKLNEHKTRLQEKDELERSAGEALKGALKGVQAAPSKRNKENI